MLFSKWIKLPHTTVTLAQGYKVIVKGQRETEGVLASTLLCHVRSQAEGILCGSNKLKDINFITIPFRHRSSEHFAGGRLH